MVDTKVLVGGVVGVLALIGIIVGIAVGVSGGGRGGGGNVEAAVQQLVVANASEFDAFANGFNNTEIAQLNQGNTSLSFSVCLEENGIVNGRVLTFNADGSPVLNICDNFSSRDVFLCPCGEGVVLRQEEACPVFAVSFDEENAEQLCEEANGQSFLDELSLDNEPETIEVDEEVEQLVFADAAEFESFANSFDNTDIVQAKSVFEVGDIALTFSVCFEENGVFSGSVLTFNDDGSPSVTDCVAPTDPGALACPCGEGVVLGQDVGCPNLQAGIDALGENLEPFCDGASGRNILVDLDLVFEPLVFATEIEFQDFAVGFNNEEIVQTNIILDNNFRELLSFSSCFEEDGFVRGLTVTFNDDGTPNLDFCTISTGFGPEAVCPCGAGTVLSQELGCPDFQINIDNNPDLEEFCEVESGRLLLNEFELNNSAIF